MADLRLCEQRKKLLKTSGNILVLGGPGSGKTTISLVKAAEDIGAGRLSTGQTILFLSFARATVARVAQEAKQRVSKKVAASIETNTYHGFAWHFIRSYGYLLTGHRQLRLLSPPDAASLLADVPKHQRELRLRELLAQQGLLGFDLFAGTTADLLEQSPRLCRMLADCYPIIILDEFQDTNRDEWRMISALGKYTQLIAMADAEQRIYEFRGADPARIKKFIERFSPTIFDLGSENNRSPGTDITKFGNDVLTSANLDSQYKDVAIKSYPYYQNDAISPIRYETLAARQRLLRSNRPNWSVAILVKSKALMLSVSNCLSTATQKSSAIDHDVLIDAEGPALAAAFLGSLLQGAPMVGELERRLAEDLVAHVRGFKGGTVNGQDLALTNALSAYLAGNAIRGSTRTSLLKEISQIATQRMNLSLVGDPEVDWLAVRRLLYASQNEKLKGVAEDARFIRLLNRGTQLRERLAECWRRTGTYRDAKAIVASALLNEHFSASTRVWSGVNVMTIHKAKGKEFDEVIIFEGSRNGRLLRNGANANDIEQARLALRVAVTRARSRTTLMTPSWVPSPLLRK